MKAGLGNQTMMQSQSNNGAQIEYQLMNIENKLKKAQDFRSGLIHGDKERLSFYKGKVEQINANKLELTEKREYNVLSQVVLKHVNKEKSIKKKAREGNVNKTFQDEKKA